jgi:hypothetical protein
MARRKRKQTIETVAENEPAGGDMVELKQDHEPIPEMVRVTRPGRVRIEGNRTIRLMYGDIFRHHMATVLWTEQRYYVEAYVPHHQDDDDDDAA